MSGALSNLASSFASIFTDPRSLGDEIPDCAIEESHLDELAITDHPVEQGASITDHAYLKPSEVTLRWAWSNSSPGNAGPLFGLLPQLGAASEQYITDVYDRLQALQQTRKPLDIVTGKRMYKSMLIASLSTSTDSKSAYTLTIIAKCRQIIIVQTAVTQGGSDGAASAEPQETQAPEQTGEQPTTPAEEPRSSILRQVAPPAWTTPISPDIPAGFSAPLT